MKEDDKPIVGRIEFDRAHGFEPLPAHWSAFYHVYKAENTKCWEALKKIRDFSGSDIPAQNLRAAIMTINGMAQQALEMGGEDEKK